ncbi:secondary thiamine-phosphate synthase enzyme YjbQ [Rhodopila sp.]|jgi:secondary thiamine-phosphate synthase enzyme|uniref:secondary thiamine-phosphate synthase enzyme YjbQ n=1 Tax=Rhodopila sp. TaxID=2480087 RepID=UPI002B70B705|nr:secondary thiamine-phosphate synthase enzyme YjbQ [Rhodopila sp.]HVZ08825.1 secondary thiamine-phosphate synthase enzyme YjbQ [Rhodopila sp.]
MRQAIHDIQVCTQGQDLYDVTGLIRAWIAQQGIRTGLLTVWCRHTSASLTVQENADPDVRADLLDFFRRTVPESTRYRHQEEGPDDMPAHIKAALTQPSVSIPIRDGEPALGTWQAVYLFEHRDAPHTRGLTLHLIGV